jgi:hypothetical protein
MAMPGLPDGIFPYQNKQFWFILRGGMEILENGIFVVFSYSFSIFLIYQIKNKMHNYNIKIITIEEIIIGII